MSAKRNIVKAAKDYVIWSASASAAAAAMETVIDEPSENQELAIGLSSAGIGFVVAHSVKARTDKMIDTVADWRQNRKVAKTVETVA